MRFKLLLVLVFSFATLLPAVQAGEAYFDSNGVKLRYLIDGAGEPVILIHGFAVPNVEDMWVKNLLNEPKVFPELAKEFRVIALELRGHGKSGKPLGPKQYGVEMVEDVVRLMDHLKIRRAHIVGYSLGAMIAGKLLVTHPDRLLSVTFGGGAPAFPRSEERLKTLHALAVSLDNGEGAHLLIPLIAPIGEALPAPSQIRFLGQTLVRGQNQKVLAEVVRGIEELEVTEIELRANKVPVLMVYGSREGEALERIGEVSKILKPMTTEIIKGGDHLTTFAVPKFRKVIRDFLKAHHQ